MGCARTTGHNSDQLETLNEGSATTLLDFLLALQQDLYIAEQARELPMWAHPPQQFVNRQVSEELPLQLTERIITNQEGQLEYYLLLSLQGCVMVLVNDLLSEQVLPSQVGLACFW